jgi:hypothetical protein
MNGDRRRSIGMAVFCCLALCSCVDERPGFDGGVEPALQAGTEENDRERNEAAALLSIYSPQELGEGTPFEDAALCTGAIAATSERFSEIPLFTDEHKQALATAGAYFQNQAMQLAATEGLSEQSALDAIAQASQKSAEEPSTAAQKALRCVSRLSRT